MAENEGILKSVFKDASDIYVAVGVIIIIMMMIIPLPTVLLDLFMAVNLGIAVLPLRAGE